MPFVLGEDKKEIDFFLKFFPTTLIEKIVDETNTDRPTKFGYRLQTQIWRCCEFM